MLMFVNLQLILDKKLFKLSTSYDLGIIISLDLKWLLLCLYVYNKANKILGMIRRTIINKEPRIMLSLLWILEE